jgi:hypothetical protein
MEAKKSKIKIGQLSPSKIEGCPVFTPIKISDQILGGLRINDNVKLKPLSFDSGFLTLPLQKNEWVVFGSGRSPIV